MKFVHNDHRGDQVLFLSNSQMSIRLSVVLETNLETNHLSKLKLAEWYNLEFQAKR